MRGEPIEFLDAVMHRMKLPQPRDRVECTVDKVEADVPDDKHLHGLQPIRLRSDHVAQGSRYDRLCGDNANHNHRRDAELDEPAVDDHVNEVVPPAAPEHALLGMHGEEALEGEEDEEEEKKTSPVEQVHAARLRC